MIKKKRITVPAVGIVITILFGLNGCGDGNKYKVDVSGYEVELKVNRLEDDLFSVKTTEDYIELDAIDSGLMAAYKKGIMGPETRDGHIPVEKSAQGFMEFINNKDMRHLYETVDSTFPSLEDLEEDLSEAFSHYHYYFPEKTIPKLYSVVSPFRAQSITTNNALAVCLDMYLGPQFTPYQTPQLQFPGFLIRRFRPDYIVPNTVKAWVESEYPRLDKDHRLLGEMIHQGKILFAMDLLMPETADSLKIGYPDGKIEWCKENEFQIWTHLIEEDLLYNTDFRTYAGVVTEGPFSKGNNVPQDSPPKIAVWAGWQIVREYMDNKPEVTLAELLNEIDYDKILSESGYKP